MLKSTEKSKKISLTTRDMAYISLFAVIIAVCSWISIPLTVPFTLQTFGVFCALGVLGGKKGTIAVSVYILLGVIGIPVFSGFKSGLGTLLGATGGYILGFLLLTLIYWVATLLFGNKLCITIAAMILGLIACYAFGTLWFMLIYAKNSGPIGLSTALGWCVFPFIIPDIIKMAMAVFISKRLKGFYKG